MKCAKCDGILISEGSALRCPVCFPRIVYHGGETMLTTGITTQTVAELVIDRANLKEELAHKDTVIAAQAELIEAQASWSLVAMGAMVVLPSWASILATLRPYDEAEQAARARLQEVEGDRNT